MRRRGAVAMLLIALAAVVVPMAVRAGTPGTDPANGDWVGGKVVSPGPEHLVLWKLPGAGGVRGTCIAAGVNGPLHGPYSLAETVSDPVYGELNHLYASAATSDVRLAELSALNSRKYDVVDRALQWSYVRNGSAGMSAADAQAMLAEATRLAGPYRVSIALPGGAAVPGQHYRATVTVSSASGARVPATAVTITGSGADPAAGTVTTDAAGQASLAFTVRAGSDQPYSLDAAVHSYTSVAVYSSRGEQRMMSAAAPGVQRGSASGRSVATRDVTLIKAAAHDTAHRPVPGYTFRVSDSAGQVVAAAVTTGSTPADADLGQLRVGETYTATEISAPAGAALYIPVVSTTRFTVPPGGGTWTVQAVDPEIPRPQLTTRVGHDVMVIGGRLSDTVTIQGDDGEDGTLDATVYGPVPVPAAGCAAVSLAEYLAAHSSTLTVPVVGAGGTAGSGNGDLQIVGPLVTVPGCYGWGEKLTLRPSGATGSSPPTAASESTLVLAPMITTAASATLATVGAAVSDHVVVSGLAGTPATLAARLLGPLAPGPGGCDGLDWAGAPTAADLPPVVLAGDGAHDTAAAPVSAPGCYTFVESLTSTVGSPPVSVTLAAAPPGQHAETVLVQAAAPRQVPPIQAPPMPPAPRQAATPPSPLAPGAPPSLVSAPPERPASLAHTGTTTPLRTTIGIGAAALGVGVLLAALGHRGRR